MDEQRLEHIREDSLSGKGIAREDAWWLMKLPVARLDPIFETASEVRDLFRGSQVSLCAIVNAKSRLCGEDCKFCAQSLHYSTGAEQYPLLTVEMLTEAARAAEAGGATCFSLVTSGESIRSAEEWATIEESVRRISSETALRTCVSLGAVSEENLLRLKKAGLVRVHHNLETSERYFPQVCTTHRHEDRIRMVERIRQAGLEHCTGGIVGLGESLEDRIDLAFQIRAMGPLSIPINVLNPIPGTPLEKQPVLDTDEALRSIALFRLVCPWADIIVAGGREQCLGERQDELFAAGASGVLIGNYLTTAGRPAAKDLKMIHRLGFVPGRYEPTSNKVEC